MADSVWTALIAVGGTGLGAAVGLGSSVWNAKFNVGAKQEEQQREVSRTACIDLVTRSVRFFDQARDLANALDEDGPIGARHLAVHEQYLADWRHVYEAVAPVELAGPVFAPAAARLRGALGGLADVCDAWFAARELGPANRRWKDFDKAKSELGEAKDALVAVAHEQLNA